MSVSAAARSPYAPSPTGTAFVDVDRGGVSGAAVGYGELVGRGLETPGDWSGACSVMVHRLVAESRMMKNCAPSAGVAGARIPKQINKRVVSMGQPHRWPGARSNYNIFAWCRSEVSLAF